jgi:hypothetical protein
MVLKLRLLLNFPRAQPSKLNHATLQLETVKRVATQLQTQLLRLQVLVRALNLNQVTPNNLKLQTTHMATLTTRAHTTPNTSTSTSSMVRATMLEARTLLRPVSMPEVIRGMQCLLVPLMNMLRLPQRLGLEHPRCMGVTVRWVEV